MSIDYNKRTRLLDVDLWYGDLDADTEAEREAYRRGQVVVSGVVWCVIEPPRTGGVRGPSRIDAGTVSDVGSRLVGVVRAPTPNRRARPTR
jgi:hypothetical protein